jgi:hypothetical protein
MPQWEYRKIDLSDVPPKVADIDLLDDAGREGWELVGITANNFAYLKRPLDDVAAAAELPAKQPTRRRAASSRASDA